MIKSIQINIEPAQDIHKFWGGLIFWAVCIESNLYKLERKYLIHLFRWDIVIRIDTETDYRPEFPRLTYASMKAF
jgi:hypothetical protein